MICLTTGTSGISIFTFQIAAIPVKLVGNMETPLIVAGKPVTPSELECGIYRPPLEQEPVIGKSIGIVKTEFRCLNGRQNFMKTSVFRHFTSNRNGMEIFCGNPTFTIFHILHIPVSQG